MKKYIFIILVIISVVNSTTFSQELTSNEEQEIIEKLDSTDFWTRSGALEEIKYYKIKDAIPKLLKNIWLLESEGLRYSYLYTLYVLEYQNFNVVAHAFIDSADNFNYEFSSNNSLLMKMKVTGLLFEIGDYSTMSYLFESIEADTLNRETLYHIGMLKNLALNVPEYKDYAVTELQKIVDKEEKNKLEKKHTFFALDALQKISSNSIVNSAKKFLKDAETKFQVRMLALKILIKENYYGLESLIKEKIENDTSNSFRLALVMKLTDEFSNPNNYVFLKNISIRENDLRMIRMLHLKLVRFKPTLPDSLTSTLNMLDTLTSYTTQCYGYEWLKDEPYKTELLTKLTTAKTKLSSGDSLGCRTEVAAFQNSVNQVYQDSAGSYPKYVNNAGYKFMYHYAQYILDRLLEAPTVEGLPVKLQDSQVNKKQQGDKIDYNTKEKIK